MSELLAVPYGAGTNSTAMLVGMHERGIVPDVIIFADTGGEKPRTYEHIKAVDAWLKTIGFPAIVIVKKVDKNGDVLTLEDDCLQRKALPSIAYGFKTCSQKFKIAPQDKYFNNLPEAKAVWKNGGKVIKCIGYDSGEFHRVKDYSDDKYTLTYPLVEWGWGRRECVEAIARAGLPQAGKSSCFFCPSMRQGEIKELAVVNPKLMDRALAMEKNAQLTQVKGLGRNFAWRDLIATDEMFPESYIDAPCGCYDGGEV